MIWPALMQRDVDASFDHWFWGTVFVPAAARPAWLLPAAIGVIFAGLWR